MFKLFKKEKPLNYTQRLLQLIMDGYDEHNVGWTTSIITNKDWQSIKFLNKRGLIKYFKTDGSCFVRIEPTLLCLYLTKVLKYDIEETYNEAVKLYNKIGEDKNGNSYRKVLFQGTTNKQTNT